MSGIRCEIPWNLWDKERLVVILKQRRTSSDFKWYWYFILISNYKWCLLSISNWRRTMFWAAIMRKSYCLHQVSKITRHVLKFKPRYGKKTLSIKTKPLKPSKLPKQTTTRIETSDGKKTINLLLCLPSCWIQLNSRVL